MIVVLALSLVASVASAVAVHAAPPPHPQPTVGSNGTRGLVFDSLFPSRPDGPCVGARFEIRGPDGVVGCTHGPDPAPDGIDARSEREASELLAAAQPAAVSAVPCIGNGRSGKRVQAIYAVASDRTDRYDTIAPLIRGWAASTLNDIVAGSAFETGGARAVRFVTDANCELVVDHVVLSPTGDDDFGATINELRAKGYTSSARKFVVWADATVYCGIAQIYLDDHAGSGNLNNGNAAIQGMVSRTDSGCWGLGGTSTPVEAHELMHTLGGVQNSAPHSSSKFPQSPGAHCTDEYDVMCYADGPGVEMDIVCADLFHERRFDCGHEDYFHTSPEAGSYLATHWNPAGSSFLAVLQSPVVSAFSPAGGTVGKVVTIDGVGFSGATAVAFNGVDQPTFTIVSDGRVTAKVPSGASTGPISVTTSLGTGFSLTSFKVRPKVTGFDPDSGPPGTLVTISGSAFVGVLQVQFNGVGAAFSALDYDTITATVPAGATTGPITVITFGGKGSSRRDFVVP